jgi:hypothetical protein
MDIASDGEQRIVTTDGDKCRTGTACHKGKLCNGICGTQFTDEQNNIALFDGGARPQDVRPRKPLAE